MNDLQITAFLILALYVAVIIVGSIILEKANNNDNNKTNW